MDVIPSYFPRAAFTMLNGHNPLMNIFFSRPTVVHLGRKDESYRNTIFVQVQLPILLVVLLFILFEIIGSYTSELMGTIRNVIMKVLRPGASSLVQ